MPRTPIPEPRTPNRIVVVGGGLAGMAAAGVLGGRGLRVLLLESRPRWGGRASSFVDQATGEVIDNCQHVILGCCNNFRHLMRLAGCETWLRREPVLWFVGPESSVNRLSASPLPAPFHLAPAFSRFRYFTLREKLLLAKGLRSLARGRPGPADETFEQWLIRHRQTPDLIERFWHVVLVSALSETVDRIDVGHARKVFVDGFLRNREGWEMWVPNVSLDQLYGAGLTDWLSRQGMEHRVQSGVRRVLIEGGRAAGVELRSGERLEADHVILAVPHHLVLDMLPQELRDSQALQGIRQLQDAPIASVHLWFDRKVLPVPHAVLVGCLSQWIFDRSQTTPGPEERDLKSEISNPKSHTPTCVQVVISAAREIEGRPQADVIRAVVDELAAIWPAVRDAQIRHARVITEHRAALSVVPGVDNLRPAQQSPIPNLQLAGDWTRTGWPSTMEGAVRSGWLAAENVLRHLGRPEPLLQPEPRTALLSRWLLGIR